MQHAVWISPQDHIGEEFGGSNNPEIFYTYKLIL